MTIHQGDCIRLPADVTAPDQLYQVIAIDDRSNRCWLRRWPLARKGSPVFEISLGQVQGTRIPQPRPSHA